MSEFSYRASEIKEVEAISILEKNGWSYGADEVGGRSCTFYDVAAFDAQISIEVFKSASYEGEMKLATKYLLGAIQKGQVKATGFTAKQLQQINAGAK